MILCNEAGKKVTLININKHFQFKSDGWVYEACQKSNVLLILKLYLHLMQNLQTNKIYFIIGHQSHKKKCFIAQVIGAVHNIMLQSNLSLHCISMMII